MLFEFFVPGRLVEGDLELILADMLPGDLARERVPEYKFKMIHAVDGSEMGRISLRAADTFHVIMYTGHIGYNVRPEFRGHRYAARACRLILPLARKHGLKTIWITCNPDNIASRRTCELVGAEFVEIVDLPEYSDMYLAGERQKCRYRLDLDPGD